MIRIKLPQPTVKKKRGVGGGESRKRTRNKGGTGQVFFGKRQEGAARERSPQLGGISIEVCQNKRKDTCREKTSAKFRWRSRGGEGGGTVG